MPRVAPALLGVVLVLNTGCTPAPRAAAEPPTPADKSVASWTATATMVGEAWLERKVRRGYALRSLRTALEHLREHSRIRNAEPHVAAIEHLRSAIEHGTDRDVRRALAELPR